MPLNIKKHYSFKPQMIGNVFLVTKNSRRARSFIGNTYFRSRKMGEQSNLIRLLTKENSDSTKGIFVIYDTTKINASNTVKSLVLDFDEKISISSSSVSVIKTDWDTGSTQTIDYGKPELNKIFVCPKITFIYTVNEEILPFTFTYNLTRVQEDIGSGPEWIWSIVELRNSITSSPNPIITMPVRGEDPQDTGTDGTKLLMFDSFMSGGDGLPISPVPYNTGPDRTLVHINMAENEQTGAMEVHNTVYEWVGDSSSIGEWSKYS